MELTKQEVLERLGYEDDEAVAVKLSAELQKEQNTALQSYFIKFSDCFIEKRLIILNYPIESTDFAVLTLARKILGDYLFGIDFRMEYGANYTDMRNVYKSMDINRLKVSSLKCSTPTGYGSAGVGGKFVYPKMEIFCKHTFSLAPDRDIRLRDTAYPIIEEWIQGKSAPMTFNEKEFQYLLATCMKH